MSTQKSQMLAQDPNSIARIIACDAFGRLLTSAAASTAWEIQFESDEATGDNDKTITIPNGHVWHILTIRVEYTSDANAGDRQLAIQFRDSSNDVIWEVRPNITQAASLTYLYHFGSSMSDLDTIRDSDWLSTPIPPTLILPSGSNIRLYDNNDISAPDDMIVHLIVGERDV